MTATHIPPTASKGVAAAHELELAERGLLAPAGHAPFVDEPETCAALIRGAS